MLCVSRASTRNPRHGSLLKPAPTITAPLLRYVDQSYLYIYIIIDGCTCPMTSSSPPTTVTETLQITVTATVSTTVLVREVCTLSLTTVVHTETCSQIMPTKTITNYYTMTTPTTSGVVLNQMEGATPPCTALGGGLGIVTGTLAILLVGVVLGWVWSCHRKRGKPHLEERSVSCDPTT